MIKRVVEVSSECQLSVSYEQLILHRAGEQIGKVPLEDLGILILDNPSITYTLQLLQVCADFNIAVIFCDSKHMPVSLIQPLTGNTLHSRTVNDQMTVNEPTKKRLWQAIVVAKLKAQAQTLSLVGTDNSKLLICAKNVKSGDSDNQESQGAAIYWKLLFGHEFRRNPKWEGINTLLNYGYAVVRASVARSLVGTGLHPAIGLHHHNQYNAFCLADDLMEPFRPAVDLTVYRYTADLKKVELDKAAKIKLFSILETTWQLDGRNQPFITVTQLFASALKNALLSGSKKLTVPVFVEKKETESA